MSNQNHNDQRDLTSAHVVGYILPASENAQFRDICLSVCHIRFVHSILERG